MEEQGRKVRFKTKYQKYALLKTKSFTESAKGCKHAKLIQNILSLLFI